MLERWREGDAKAGERLTARYYASVLRFFEPRASQHAEDLTQRTFLACVEVVEDDRLHTSFRAYLFGTARRLLSLHLRKTYQRRHASVLETAEDEGFFKTSLTGIMARCEEHTYLLQAMAKLPADMQVTVQLFYWEGLSTLEIAEATDVPRSTVTTRLSRARDRLRSNIRRLKLPRAVASSLENNLEGWTRSLVSRRR